MSVVVALATLAGCTSGGSSGGGVTPPPTPTPPYATATTLNTSASTLMLPSRVSLTATVTSASGTVAGTVTFYDGTTAIASGATLTNGSVSIENSLTYSGTHNFTAVYSGSTNFLTSTSAIAAVNVTAATTTTSLSSYPVSIPAGGSVTLTSTTVGAYYATGTVTFYDGTKALGSSTLAPSSTDVSFMVSSLTTGAHSFTAVYNGDGYSQGSTSNTLTINVGTGLSTTTTLTSSSSSGYPTTGVTLTSTVVSPSATGLVAFYAGTQLLGTTALVSGAATLQAHPPVSGGGALTAGYSGDATYASSISNSVPYTVLALPSINLTISASTVTLGSPLTMTTTLNPSTTTGSMTFHDGYSTHTDSDGNLVHVIGPAIGTATVVGGLAMLTTSGLAAGSHILLATYLAGLDTISSNHVNFVATPANAACGLGTALYVLTSGSATLSGQNLPAANTDESSVCATNTGTSLTLSNPTLSVQGNSSSVDNSGYFGLDSAVLAYGSSATTASGGSITLQNSGPLLGGGITTAATGANGVFASGKGASVSGYGLRISTSGSHSHAVDVSQSGTVSLSLSLFETTGAYSAVIASEPSGGTVTVTGETARSTGPNSPAIRAAGGTVTVASVTASSTADSGAVVDGSGALVLNGTTLTGALHGVSILNTTAVATAAPSVVVTNGSITAASGDGFNVTGPTTASITLKGGTTLTTSTGIVVDSLLGANTAVSATGQKMTGNMVCDANSTLSLSLTTGTMLTGAINASKTAKTLALTLDAASTWNVTATSYVTTITDPEITGSTVTNIVGNGYTVYYLSSANPALNGTTYVLAGSARGFLSPL
jgi:Bacterial Ig-like domain (group 3)